MNSHSRCFKNKSLLRARTNNRRAKNLLHQPLYYMHFFPARKELLINVLSYEGAIKKCLWQYFKDVVPLAEERPYLYLLVSFVENVSGASSLNDDPTSVLVQHVKFRDCLVFLSLRIFEVRRFGKPWFWATCAS